MENVKIYEIKASANENYKILKSTDKPFFYWNDLRFKKNDIGDYVFIINRVASEALFTRIIEKEIPTTFNAVTNSTEFKHNNNDFAVPGGNWGDFILFEVLESRTIPQGWNWKTILGSSETYDLWKPDLIGDTKRKEKIFDLEIIFYENNAYLLLQRCKQLIDGTSILLEPEIEKAIENKRISELIESHEFLHQLATDKLHQLIEYNSSGDEDIYTVLIDRIKEKEVSFIDFLNNYKKNTAEFILLKLIGEVIAYCDLNAANKFEFNKYEDKRVLAKSSVRQTTWVENLLKYKASNCDVNSISSLVIRNAINYLLTPELELTMLSENHRKMAARYLLKTAYDKSSFVVEMLSFFKPYRIVPKNPLNYTKIISEILYRFPEVKKLWFEKIEGLVVCDNTGWIDLAIEDLKETDQIILWWDKQPSGGASTLKLLKDQIYENGFFYIYYTKNQEAFARSRIINFSVEKDYKLQQWNRDKQVAWYKEDFDDYVDERANGTIKKARIVFLADEIIKLQVPISYEYFEFYKNFQPPTQNNMQPYAEMNIEVEAELIDVDIPEEKQIRSIDATINKLDFNDKFRSVLMALKTKPLVILAGISGIGKSRLARTLAYKTCALEELQNESPDNFLLIQVKPNWHDSTELFGYESRLTGKPEFIITPLIRFLVKAWKYSEIPFILCLDEMNLAPVEQYFAEFLSSIESREYKNGKLVTDALISKNIFQKYSSDTFWGELGITNEKSLQEDLKKFGLRIPINFMVIGTVNMDETTHSFSRKVLDRAMTIEMNEVNLHEGLQAENTDWAYPDKFYSPEIIFGAHTYGGQVFSHFDKSGEILSFLAEINLCLDKTPFKFAYRVRDEALIYCYHNLRATDENSFSLTETLDELVCMKILSRIEGDESKTEKVIEGLLDLLVEKDYPLSNSKLREMQNRLKSFGYTSFWP